MKKILQLLFSGSILNVATQSYAKTVAYPFAIHKKLINITGTKIALL